MEREKFSLHDGPIRLILPLPPSSNDYWFPIAKRINGKWIGILTVSSTARAYKNKVAEILRLQGIEPVEKGVLVAARYVAYPPARNRDLTNYGKVLWDALEGLAYVNDRQIYQDGPHYHRKDAENPRVEVFLSLYEEPEWLSDGDSDSQDYLDFEETSQIL